MDNEMEKAGVRSEGATLSLGDVVSRLWSARLLILTLSGGCFVAAAAISLFLDPVYRATTTVAEAEAPDVGSLSSLATQFSGLAALGGFDLGTSPSLDQSLAVLDSVPFTQAFLSRENAYQELFRNDWDPQKNALKSAFRGDADSWTSKIRGWFVKAPGASANSAGASNSYLQWEAFRRFDAHRHIDIDRKTRLVTIGVDARDPQTAARWANDLIAELNAELRSRAIQESNARIRYLENQVNTTAAVELRDALYRLIEAEQKRSLVANTRAEYALRVLSPAVPPDMRISPHRTLIAISGGIAGAMLAVLWVLLVRIARTSGVRSAGQSV